MAGSELPHCPHCGEDVESPGGRVIKTDQVFDDDFNIDVTASVQQHFQLECPHCETVLGYLALGAAAGGPNRRGPI